MAPFFQECGGRFSWIVWETIALEHQPTWANQVSFIWKLPYCSRVLDFGQYSVLKNLELVVPYLKFWMMDIQYSYLYMMNRLTCKALSNSSSRRCSSSIGNIERVQNSWNLTLQSHSNAHHLWWSDWSCKSMKTMKMRTTRHLEHGDGSPHETWISKTTLVYQRFRDQPSSWHQGLLHEASSWQQTVCFVQTCSHQKGYGEIVWKFNAWGRLRRPL